MLNPAAICSFAKAIPEKDGRSGWQHGHPSQSLLIEDVIIEMMREIKNLFQVILDALFQFFVSEKPVEIDNTCHGS